MATTTTHYGFTKPGVNDYVDISVLNANYDNLDNVIYNNQLRAQAALDDLAPEYDATATYSVGDYVTYNKTLYKCTTAIATAEAFDDTKWTAVKVGGELKSHDTRISTLEAGVDLEKSATNSFDDGIDSYFKKVVSTIVPVQAGSGTPSPTNVRPITGFTECAVLDISDSANASYFMGLLKGTHGFINLGTLEWGYNTSYAYPTFASSALTSYNVARPSDVITCCCSALEGISNRTNTAFMDADNEKKCCFTTNTLNPQLYIQDSTYSDATAFKTAMNGVYLIYELATPTTPTITDAQMQTLLTAFGYTGSSATISFGSAGTVYGGYVDLVSGRLVVDRKYIEPTAIYGVITNYLGIYYWTITLPESSLVGEELISSHFKYGTTIQLGNMYTTGSGGRTLVVVPTDQSLNTKALADAWLQANNPQFVYKLATPQEYQLTPAQLRSLVGTNRLTSSTGEVTEVEYIKNKTIAWLLDLIRAS